MEQQPKPVSKPTSSSTDLQKVLEALTSQSEQMKRLEQSAGIQSERMKRLEEENNELKLHLAGLESRKNKRRQSGPEREIRQVPNPNDHERNPNGDKGNKGKNTDNNDIPNDETGRDDEEGYDDSQSYDSREQGEQSAQKSQARIPQNHPQGGQKREDEILSFALRMEKEVAEIKKKMYSIPGVQKPLDAARLGSYSESPFIDDIAFADLPERFAFPTMPKYDGKSDPDQHLAQYRQIMLAAVLPADKRHAAMCRGFGISLIGPALMWWTNLPQGKITSFSHLTDIFVEQFASSRVMVKTSDDLYRIVMRPDESYRDLLKRFTAEMVSIPNCDPNIAVQAFKRALPPTCGLYQELVLKRVTTWPEVQSYVWSHINLQEDDASRNHALKMNQGLATTSLPANSVIATNAEKTANQQQNNLGSTDRRSKRQRGRNFRFHPYTNNNEQGDKQKRDPPPPRYEEFNMSIGPAEMVSAFEKMDRVKWPKPMTTPVNERDTTRYCDYHKDVGHRTEDCWRFRKEVAFQLKHGNLQHLLKNNTTNNAGRDQRQNAPAQPPQAVRTINTIIGGSAISGMSYSAAKRHARSLPKELEWVNGNVSNDQVVEGPITFNDADIQNVQMHDDALVISLLIANCLTKRILVDAGSSVNIIYLQTVKELQLESQIIKAPTVLVFGNGTPDRTIGEISLMTFAAGINALVKFQVMDCPSTYNALLGRPWIHQMKAVPSTLHQSIKFSTPWGVREIKGDQRMARECYQAALKGLEQSPPSA